MKLTIEVNDRGSTVIEVSVDNRKVIVTSSSILSDDNERCEIEISELLKFISIEAYESLLKAIANLDKEFEFEDKTCSIY